MELKVVKQGTEKKYELDMVSYTEDNFVKSAIIRLGGKNIDVVASPSNKMLDRGKPTRLLLSFYSEAGITLSEIQYELRLAWLESKIRGFEAINLFRTSPPDMFVRDRISTDREISRLKDQSHSHWWK